MTMMMIKILAIHALDDAPELDAAPELRAQRSHSCLVGGDNRDSQGGPRTSSSGCSLLDVAHLIARAMPAWSFARPMWQEKVIPELRKFDGARASRG